MNEGQHIRLRITSVTALILLSTLLSLSLITTLSDTSAIAPNENSRYDDSVNISISKSFEDWGPFLIVTFIVILFFIFRWLSQGDDLSKEEIKSAIYEAHAKGHISNNAKEELKMRLVGTSARTTRRIVYRRLHHLQWVNLRFEEGKVDANTRDFFLARMGGYWLPINQTWLWILKFKLLFTRTSRIESKTATIRNLSTKQTVDDILSEDFSEESGYEKLHYFGMSQKEALEYYYNEKEILTLSYNEGSPTRLPYTSMFDNSIPRLKIEQFNLTPKGDSWENIEIFSLSRDLRVFGINENIQRIIDENGEISWDVETVGLHRTIGLNKVNEDGFLEVYKGNYEMGLKTNQIPDFRIPEIDNSPRKLDACESGKLSPLNESMMYNQLGVDLLIRTSNNAMILTQRAEYSSRENKKGVSIWARRWNSPCTFVFTNILQDSIGANPITLLSIVEKELRSRFEITKAEIESFEVHGISRSLIMAGTPSIHCMVNINLTHDEVKDRIIQKDHFLVRVLNPKSKDWRSQDNESSFVYIDGNDSLNALDQIIKSCGKETSPILLASLAMWQRFEHNSTNAPVPMERKNKDSEEVENNSTNTPRGKIVVEKGGIAQFFGEKVETVINTDGGNAILKEENNNEE